LALGSRLIIRRCTVDINGIKKAIMEESGQYRIDIFNNGT